MSSSIAATVDSVQNREDNNALAAGLTRARACKWLCCILLLAAAADLFFYTGFYASDDVEYFDAAAKVLDEGCIDKSPLLGATRLSVLAWNCIFGAMSRANVHIMAASYVVAHQILILLTYVLAVKVCNRFAGLLAAWTTAMFPLFVAFSTGIYPDFLIAIFFVLSLLAFIKAYEMRERGRLLLATVFMLLCGLAVGGAYMAKESGLTALPFYFMAWLVAEFKWSRRSASRPVNQSVPSADGRDNSVGIRPGMRRSSRLLGGLLTGTCFLLGFAMVFGFEYKMLAYLTGNPKFFRLGWTSKEQDLEKVRNFHIDGGFNPLNRLVASHERLGEEYFPLWLKFVFLGAVLVFPFVRRMPWVVLLFGAWFYLFSTLGTYSFTHYYPPRIQARYYIPAFPFLITAMSVAVTCVLGAMIARIRSRKWISMARGALITIIALSPLTYLRGPNALASYLYRSYYARHMNRAAIEANSQNTPLILVSGHLSQRARPLWYSAFPKEKYGRRPENMLTANELPAINWRGIAKAGFFHYIENPSYFTSHPIQRQIAEFDALVHPAIKNELVVHPAKLSRSVSRLPEAISAQFFASLSPRQSGVVHIHGMELRPVLQTRYKSEFRTRTREILHRLTNSQECGNEYFRPAHKIDLYRIDAVDCRMEPVATHDLFTHLSFNKNADGEFHLEFLGDNRIPEELRTDPRRRYLLHIMTELPRDATASIHFEAFTSATALGKPMASLQAPLINGESSVGFYCPEEAVYVRPSIRVTGTSAKITRLSLEVLEEEKRSD